jgi:hypothetical protein
MVNLVCYLVTVGLIGWGSFCFSADLDLEPVTLFKCWRALSKLNSPETPIVPTRFKKGAGQEAGVVPLFPQLNLATLKKGEEQEGPG